MQCWDLSSMISGIALDILDFLGFCMCGRVCVHVARGDIYIGVAERREIRAEGGLFRLNIPRVRRCILRVLCNSRVIYAKSCSIEHIYTEFTVQ